MVPEAFAQPLFKGTGRRQGERSPSPVLEKLLEFVALPVRLAGLRGTYRGWGVSRISRGFFEGCLW